MLDLPQNSNNGTLSMTNEGKTELTSDARLASLTQLIADLEKCLEKIDALKLHKAGALVDEASQICRNEASTESS